MARSIPKYIIAAGVTKAPSLYRWDEGVEEEVLFSQPRIADRIGRMSYRAALAFALGSLEWTLYKLQNELANDEPFLLLDAAWAGLVDWMYLKSFDLPEWEDEYAREVAGPLERSFWLLKESFVAAREGKPFIDMPVSISEVALRICGQADAFKAWRRFCIARMISAYPKDPRQKLGRPVPRDALDPAYSPSPTRENERLAVYMANLDWTTNRFLRSPDELQAAGFSGLAYSWGKAA